MREPNREKIMSNKECVLSDDGKDFTPCDTLDLMFEDSRSKKGLSWFVLTNLTTGKTSRAAACLKSGIKRKNGILLNFCPFCGKRILDEKIWCGESKPKTN